MLALKFRAFHAIKNRDLAEQFLIGHRQVLCDYGISNITTNNEDWMDNPNIYAVIAENERSELVGGIRVHIANGIQPLPVEKAIGHIDPRISEVIQTYFSEGIGELCALWNAKSVAGCGVSLLLTRSGISIVNQLCCSILMGICADYTLNMFQKVGFLVDTSFGNDGKFAYPNESYRAQVLKIPNTNSMSTAIRDERERILDLRSNPVQVVVENGIKYPIKVEYDLLIS